MPWFEFCQWRWFAVGKILEFVKRKPSFCRLLKEHNLYHKVRERMPQSVIILVRRGIKHLEREIGCDRTSRCPSESTWCMPRFDSQI